MKRLLLASAVLFGFCGHAAAWGDVGHKIVCEIAQRLAEPDTRAEIRRLVQLDSQFDFFRDACTGPDHPHTRPPEHFVNLPRTLKSLKSDTCPLAAKCLLTAIESDLAVLSSSASDTKKLTALKYVGHWIGDLHQPLHVSFKDDKGGNDIAVEGECSGKLHSTWDTCLVLKELGSDPVSAAKDLIKSITPTQKEQWVAGEPRDWANESFAIATAAATKYCVQQGGSCEMASDTVEIDTAYVEMSGPIIRERLSKAGVRLANMLNTAFGN
jgi:nuclease S1